MSLSFHILIMEVGPDGFGATPRFTKMSLVLKYSVVLVLYSLFVHLSQKPSSPSLDLQLDERQVMACL